jgi:hypothetical protein
LEAVNATEARGAVSTGRESIDVVLMDVKGVPSEGGFALASVECHMARFSEKTARCRSCKTTWKQHEEKETDVHFSLTFLEDAMDNVFDRALIISADSDHVPALRRVRARLPSKQIFAATPPGRHAHARELLKVCTSGINITPGRIARCLFPEVIKAADGSKLATRPKSYDPPMGWTPPIA